MASSASSSEEEQGLKEWNEDPQAAFEAGVWCGLNLWDALILAVENGWAGRSGEDKLDNLYNDIMNVFEDNEEVHADELEDLLQQAIKDDFNTDAQDGSAAWLSRLFVQLRKDCFTKKDFTGLTRLLEQSEKRNRQVSAQRVRGEDESESSEEDSEDEEEDEETEEKAEAHEEKDGPASATALNQNEPVASSMTSADTPSAQPTEEDAEWEVVSSKNRKGKGRPKK